MTLYLVYWTSSYDGSERRDGWDNPDAANRAVDKIASMGQSIIAAYCWTGPTEAVCGRCKQDLELSLGEWRNPCGVPRCPEVHDYPFRHEPAGVQAVPWSGFLPAWWGDPAGWEPSPAS
jgi:hypothetical protein